MAVLALYPLPIFSSIICVLMTWVVLGVRRAFYVFLISFTTIFYTTGWFLVGMLESVFNAINQIRLQMLACQTQACLNAVIANVNTNLLPNLQNFLTVEQYVLVFAVGGIIFSLWRRMKFVKSIRRHTASIRKYYWGNR